MNFKQYQEDAKGTIQDYIKLSDSTRIVPFLGLIGEAGSVITELKKRLRDGDAYTGYKNRLEEELGDVLWYISAIATENGLELEKIAKSNIEKINDRFSEDNPENFIVFDEDYPEAERFPREFEIKFEVHTENGKEKVQIVYINGKEERQLGDSITDNSYDDDGYRFHDIFHYGFVAYLGWSPVVRKFLGIKRKSHDAIDEVEDGARAAIVEELISLYIYSYARDHQLFKYSESVDTEILKNVKKLTSGIEVKDCSQKQWEMAIINSYRVFDEIKKYQGGRVLVSVKNRKLMYIGKK